MVLCFVKSLYFSLVVVAQRPSQIRFELARFHGESAFCLGKDIDAGPTWRGNTWVVDFCFARNRVGNSLK